MGCRSELAHWDSVYAAKGEAEASWFQETPTPSLELLDLVGARPFSAIIDIGGGESRLVDSLLDRGFENITVLDLSAKALAETRALHPAARGRPTARRACDHRDFCPRRPRQM